MSMNKIYHLTFSPKIISERKKANEMKQKIVGIPNKIFQMKLSNWGTREIPKHPPINVIKAPKIFFILVVTIVNYSKFKYLNVSFFKSP